MEDKPTPILETPLNESKNNENENSKINKEKIIESQQYKLIKNNKIYNISINKTKDNILINCFNYENRLSIIDLSKLTKIYMDNIDNAYKFIKNVFDNKKVIIKDIEINKIIRLQIIIFDFNGKENNIEINLIYNKENKDYIINELSMKCNNFEEEISKLK